jgi:hypothetical protein
MTTGDYTDVALRPDERWTAARMQQGRVLLDHEWNLNVDAAARGTRHLAADAIGPAGVVAGSDAFAVLQVETAPGGTAPDLRIGAGRMWVGGMEAFAPSSFRHSDQPGLGPLPTTGQALVYLDVFVEHVQPAEDPTLVDPALAPVDTAARERIGYRVRVAPTQATTCADAFAALDDAALSAGTMSIWRQGVGAPADPCDPPGDPLGVVPDGLLRIEVLEAGSASGARYAWTFDAGAAALPVTAVAGAVVTVAPSPATKLAVGDLVEVSPLHRRGNRTDHGALYEIVDRDGDDLTLDRAVPADVASASGVAIRRWDGQVVGATQPRTARLDGRDLGIRFQAQSGRCGRGTGGGPAADCRRSTGRDPHPGSPGRHGPRVRAARARRSRAAVGAAGLPAHLPAVGRPRPRPGLLHHGRRAGRRPAGRRRRAPCQRWRALPGRGGVRARPAGRAGPRRRVVVTGAGPATILRARGVETAVLVVDSSDITLTRLRVEGGRPQKPQPGMNGAITVLRSDRVLVQDCQVSCPDGGARDQTCVTAASVLPQEGGTASRHCGDVEIRDCLLEAGAWQTGALLLDCDRVTVHGTRLRLRPSPRPVVVPANPILLAVLAEALVPAEEPTFTSVGTARNRVEETLAGTRMAPIAAPMRSFVTTERAARHRTFHDLAGAFTRSLSGERLEVFDPAVRDALERAITTTRFVRQGIVVAGTRPVVARIHDNVVADVAQGIHVSASHADVAGDEQVRDVSIRDNEVRCLVPTRYARERHAVFVGNATTVEVAGTLASLVRPDRRIVVAGKPTQVEAVRVYGRLGPAMSVRDTRTTDFTVGVRVTPLAPFPAATHRVWRVADTVAAGGTHGCVAPTSGSAAVSLARNVP